MRLVERPDLLNATALMNLPNSRFSIPTRVRFGAGEVANLGECLEEIGSKKPLLVTDPGMLKTGAYRKVESALKQSGVAVSLFGQALPNPTEENVERAADQFRTSASDSLIGFGGGSALDVAKAVALRVSFEGPLEGYQPHPQGPALAPVIAIPTTSGTGSEVGRATVVVLRSTGHKEVLFDPRLMPKCAILDPELTLDLPKGLTAATGMDAFTHCIESYVSPVFHPVADSIALGGLEIIVEHLPAAYEDGKNLEARGYMMIAAMMGALAFQKDLGAAHAMAHPLSTICGVHHGLANAVVLPYVMEFNVKTVERKYARVGRIFDPGLTGAPEGEAARSAIESVKDLNSRIGIASNLRELGVAEKDLAPLAEAASKDGCRLTNPRECGLDEFKELFQKAYSG